MATRRSGRFLEESTRGKIGEGLFRNRYSTERKIRIRMGGDKRDDKRSTNFRREREKTGESKEPRKEPVKEKRKWERALSTKRDRIKSKVSNWRKMWTERQEKKVSGTPWGKVLNHNSRKREEK